MTEPYWEPLGAMPVDNSAMVCLFDQVLGVAAPNFDIQNISQAYAHLKILGSLRSDGNPGVSYTHTYMRFNNDSGANYDGAVIVAHNAVSAAEALGQTQIQFGDSMPALNAPAGRFMPFDATIPNYTSPVSSKNIVGKGTLDYVAGAAGHQLRDFSGTWRTVGVPINRFTIFPAAGNFVAGSRLTIYGMLSAGQPSIPTVTLAPGGIGTSFPVSPTNGELFTLVDSLTAPTYAWDFRYVASITDAYKWVFVGGAPGSAEIPTSQPPLASDAWGDLATVGPQFIIPRAGIYFTESSARVMNVETPSQQSNMHFGVCIGTGTPVGPVATASIISGINGLGTFYETLVASGRITFAAADQARLRYYFEKGTAGNPANRSFSERRLHITPVRLS